MAKPFNYSPFGAQSAVCDICNHRRCDPRYSHVKCAKIRSKRPVQRLPDKGVTLK